MADSLTAVAGRTPVLGSVTCGRFSSGALPSINRVRCICGGTHIQDREAPRAFGGSRVSVDRGALREAIRGVAEVRYGAACHFRLHPAGHFNELAAR